MILSADIRNQKIRSPFGYEARLLKKLHVSLVNALYLDKCNIDILGFFDGFEYLELYECKVTEYKFWMPENAAGSEEFYHLISKAWKNYYRESRWEYDIALRHIVKEKTILEIGCGKGYFLKKAEKKCKAAAGLEFNTQAIRNKVCDAGVWNQKIEEHEKEGHKYDMVLSFQVLEHVINPKEFLMSAVSCLKDNGYLILSTPNDDWIHHQRMEDAFNLPPHHIGCFNRKVYENIASEFGMEIVEIKTQECSYSMIQYGERSEANILFKIFRKISQIIGSGLLRLTNEPGHTIICVMRKS